MRLYDTMTGAVRDFVPLRPGHVSIYLCGATVQGLPHIGHVRSGVAFDIVRRWLMAKGYDVAFIRNVTDIEDKIIARAKAEQLNDRRLDVLLAQRFRDLLQEIRGRLEAVRPLEGRIRTESRRGSAGKDPVVQSWTNAVSERVSRARAVQQGRRHDP